MSRQLARFYYSAAGWPLGAQRAAHQPRVLTEALDGLDAQEWHWSVRQARQGAQAAHHQCGVEIDAHGAPQPAQDSRSRTISSTTRVKRRSTKRSCSTSRLRVSIVDDGGHVLLQLRHPRATIASGDSPFAKARTAVRLGVDAGARPPTSPLVPAFVAGVPWPFAVFPGGLVRRNSASQIVDAGESVDPTEDTGVATAARAALTTDI